MALPPEICAQSDPPPLGKRRLRPISAHNVGTATASDILYDLDAGIRNPYFLCDSVSGSKIRLRLQDVMLVHM